MKKIAMTFLLLTGPLVALECPTEGPYRFKMYCRGGLRVGIEGVGVSDQLIVRLRPFLKNPTHPGLGGERLQSGTCAFSDRPITSAEPLEFEAAYRGDAGRHKMGFDVATRCLSDRRCVLHFCTYNKEGKSFAFLNFHMETVYPAFPE